jgi:hypothetical protein
MRIGAMKDSKTKAEESTRLTYTLGSEETKFGKKEKKKYLPRNTAESSSHTAPARKKWEMRWVNE